MGMRTILAEYHIFKTTKRTNLCTKLTLGLIEIKLKEHNLQNDTELIVIHAESEIDLGSIKTTFLKRIIVFQIVSVLCFILEKVM